MVWGEGGGEQRRGDGAGPCSLLTYRSRDDPILGVRPSPDRSREWSPTCRNGRNGRNSRELPKWRETHFMRILIIPTLIWDQNGEIRTFGVS